MSEMVEPVRPHLLRGGRAQRKVDPRVTAQAAIDLRVSMVLGVLNGRSVDEVAEEWDIESSLLHRWVRDFLVAGSAAITNRPDPKSWLSLVRCGDDCGAAMVVLRQMNDFAGRCGQILLRLISVRPANMCVFRPSTRFVEPQR